MAKPRVNPLSKAARLQESRLRRAGTHLAPGVHAPSAIQAWYQKQLEAHVDAMQEDIAKTLFDMLRNSDIATTDAVGFQMRDGIVDLLIGALQTLRKRWDIGDQTARALAGQFVGRVDKKTQGEIEKVVGNAMGVDLAKILNTEGIRNVVEAGIAANVQLIKSIPQQYLDKVEMIVTQEGTKGRSGKSLIKQIQEVYPVTQNRARVIARDQTSKLNGDITRQRQTAAGIRAYRWRTVGDSSVRETHKERNGKFYAWRPEDVGGKLEDGTVLLDPEAEDIGHPGEDYQCRCIAEPVIELDRII